MLNPTTEAINGRSAMLGFVAAVISEEITHHSIWSQVSLMRNGSLEIMLVLRTKDIAFYSLLLLAH